MKTKLIVSIIMLIISTALIADNLDFSFTVEIPKINNGQFTNKLPKTAIPGEPMIPYLSEKILLPYGQEIVNIKIADKNLITLSGKYEIDFAKTPLPTDNSFSTITEKDENIYGSKNLYPGNFYHLVSVQRFAGHSIAIINLFPYQYSPLNGEVGYMDNISISIETKYNNDIAEQQAKMLCSNSNVINRIQTLVVNDDLLSTYTGKEEMSVSKNSLVSVDDPHDYIIITGQNFVSIFDDFVNWKIGYGLNPAIYTMEDINSEYIGVDSADKLRNFIIDAYTVWNSTSTPLEYVLLGGDDEIVPLRLLYVNAGGTIGYIPSDFYFSALDGNWNADGDDKYGELEDDPDFIPEVAIGRIPGDIEVNFINALNKIISYTEIPKPALEKACMVGENLNWNPVTWGGDYKDDILSRIPEDNYHFYTLYQRDGTYSEQAVKDMLNNGCGIMNNMGHANYWILMGISPTYADQFTNNEYGLMYSQGCLPAAFDEMTSQSGEAVAERLVIAVGGPMAFIGNTRYGWYSPGSIEGPSQQFDRTFFDGLFAEDIKKLGDCNNYSKVELINQANNAWMRWCYYELVLFGDPHTEIQVLDNVFPYIEPLEVSYDDSNGDGDGILNPGEQIEIYLSIQNLPEWTNAEDVQVKLITDDPNLAVIDSISNYGSLAPGASANNDDDPFIVQISDNISNGDVSYQFYITANNNSQYPFSHTYTQSFSVSTNQVNWPKNLGSASNCSPIFIDFNNDGEIEMITADVADSGKIYVFDSNGNNIDNFPVQIDGAVRGSPAVGDIDNDGEYEIAVTTRNKKIYAIDNNGQILFEKEAGYQFICTPSLADLDNDGNLETIATGLDNKLYVYKYDGTPLPNFPLDLGMPLINDVSITDIDEDSILDILVSNSDGDLFAVSGNGYVINDFNIQTGSLIWGFTVVYQNGERIAFANNEKLYIVNRNGDILLDMNTESPISSSLIVFDYNDDGNYEIGYCCMNGKLNIIDQQGNSLPGWPQYLCNNSEYSPVVVELNDDNILDILIPCNNGNIYAFDIYGQILAGFPIQTSRSITSSLVVDDFDGDGDFEIAVGNYVGITVIDYKKDKGARMPWNMYRGNIRRTGNYADNVNTPVDYNRTNILPRVLTLKQNYPNPFNPTTTISFSIPSDSKVELSVYNIKGQRIKTLIDNKLEKGKHSIVWNGTDASSKRVSSGIYFYRVKAENQIAVRKMLLLK